MGAETGRYSGAKQESPKLAKGWRLERLTQPSPVFGANGLRTAADGRVYIAQVAGSQISALDVTTGSLETISAAGSDIVAPDDIDFGPNGDLYITEYYDGRVSVRASNGQTRVLRDDLPGANGITFYKGRLFVDECRIGGRLMELDLNGGAPKVLVENLALPNALEVGPDGNLYYPVVGMGEIWRIHPDGGTPERVAGELPGPVAIKFDAKGYIVSPQIGTGQVLRIDPQSGEKTTLAQLAPGLDNLTFVGDRLFVSSLTGEVREVLSDGTSKAVLPRGLSFPFGLTVDADGKLYVADGHHFFELMPGGELRTIDMLVSPTFPGNMRGVVATGENEFVVSVTQGGVIRYLPLEGKCEPLAQGLDQPYGIAVQPDGTVIAAELAAGRVVAIKDGGVKVLASGLDQPSGVAIGANDGCFVAEMGAGRIVNVTSSGADEVVSGLQQPQGLAVSGDQLYVVDAGAHAVVQVDLKNKTKSFVAENLPVGAPAGVTLKPLRGIMPFSGPQDPFAGITVGPKGELFVSANQDGSVLALRKE